MGMLLTEVDEKRPSVQQPLSNGNVALPFVIPSATEGSAVPRTIPGNVIVSSALLEIRRPEQQPRHQGGLFICRSWDWGRQIHHLHECRPDG
jgi:hypothetical protein